MAFLKPRYIKSYGTGRYLTKSTKITAGDQIILKFLGAELVDTSNSISAYSHVNFIDEIPQALKERISQEFSDDFAENDEAYIIDASDDINVYSKSSRGLFYGCMELIQLMDNGYLENALIYDYPVSSVRGVKVYLPGQENIPFFKEFVDMISYYKYNTIMIEVGGAMEYKRHPEINKKWVEYCKEMSEYSGKTNIIQEHTFKWYKNSIHVENGAGSYLSQETTRELVNYCKERKLNVIAEVPSLSHCDYFVMTYPEIRERKEDPYPDTYCPSNPRSYELLFDILEEVIDVFKPEIINVGHDEYYSIGICDKCRERKAEEIYADDVNKIYDFLKERDIKTMIWAEKLLNARREDGRGCGGAEVEMYQAWDFENGEYLGKIPATYKAMNLVPKDLECLNWYWEVDGDLDEQFHEAGREITYGNFKGSLFKDWKKRISRGVVKGGIISNWSTLKEENLQRNGMLFEVVYSSQMFWNKDYDEAKRDELARDVLKELYRLRNSKLIKESKNRKTIPGSASFIKVLHTTDKRIEYKEFVDGIFIENDVYTLGDYVLMYEDGSEERLPVIYGTNISNGEVSWTPVERLIVEASYTTLPIQADEWTYYECIFKNPQPAKRIKGIYMEQKDEKEYRIFLREFSLI